MFLPLSCERLEQDKTTTSSTPSPASHTASAVESPPPSQPPAAPTESHQDTRRTAPPTQPVCEEPTPPNNLPAPSSPLHRGKDGRDLLRNSKMSWPQCFLHPRVAGSGFRRQPGPLCDERCTGTRRRLWRFTHQKKSDIHDRCNIATKMYDDGSTFQKQSLNV